MKFLQLFKGSWQSYFSYILAGLGLWAIYFLIVINWTEIIGGLFGNPSVGYYDDQPAIFRFLHDHSVYFLWIILGILLIRGVIKKNLVGFVSVGFGFLLCYIGLVVYLLYGPMVEGIGSF